MPLFSDETAMTTKVTLKFPFVADGIEYNELNMRRCKVKDRRLAGQKKTDEEKEITLIANLCDVPPSVIDELDSVDYGQLQGVLRGFFGLATPS